MAKKTGSILGDISGKLGDEVHVNSGGNSYVKKAPQKKQKNYGTAFVKQSKNTGPLSRLASEINNVIRHHANRIKDRKLYFKLLGIFKKQESDDRIILLHSLKGLEVNEMNTLAKLNTPPTIEISSDRNTITVELQVEHHPNHSQLSSNCYKIIVALICWTTEGVQSIHSDQKTSMLPDTGPLPYFEFEFPKPKGVTEYMVAVRESLGKNGEELDLMNSQGMQIVHVGTFSKESQMWLDTILDQRAKQKAQLEKAGRKKVVVEKVVEPKGWK